MIAHLVLADGTTYTGTAAGADGTAVGEAVFCTSMTGYQEILTDPSYAGQIVTLTYPLVGNYGTADGDWESGKVQASALVVCESAPVPSHWRAQGSLRDFLTAHNVVSIAGIDTRDLTRRLRSHGVMMGAVSTEATPDELKQLLRERENYSAIDWVRQVTTDAPYVWPSATGDVQYKIALLDCGVKHNILRSLANLGCQVSVFPARTSAADILASRPDGVFLSPGPGDPALLGDVVREVRTLSQAKPLMGICLGNQLLGCAYGGRTFKLPFGHRGANHPVKDMDSGRVYITSQNHGYALEAGPFSDPELRVAQVSLNDGTVEGLRHSRLPVFSIQYHPEASPGPMDTGGYFADFLRLIDERG